MRVLWLSHFVPWPATGSGMLQRSHALLRGAAQRHEVHLVALNDPRLLGGEALAEARARLGSLCTGVDVVARDGFGARGTRLLAYARTLASGEPYDVEWTRSAALDARLAELAAGARFDLLHLDTVGLAPHARRFAGVASVLNHHNVESAMMERRASLERSRPRRALFRRETHRLLALERRCCPLMDVNLAVSETDAERLREVVGPIDIRVVPNGVDTGYFSPRLEPGHGDGGLVFAGGMDWYPNRDAALFFAREIWPALRRDRGDRRAVLVGAAAPAEVHAAVAASEGRLEAPGFVDDVRPWIDAASIYVCPIRDGGGTRLKILDALAMAKPIVATAIAVEGLALEPERHYLPAETPDDYVRQIGRLEREPALRQRLARDGRRLVEERYAWTVIGEALEAAYRAASSPEREPRRGTEALRSSPTRPRAAGCEAS